jgi:hypothetical protein
MMEDAPPQQSSSIITHKWLQETAESIKLPVLNPHVCNILIPIIEAQVKKIAQQAHKFQRRAKSSQLSGKEKYLIAYDP